MPSAGDLLATHVHCQTDRAGHGAARSARPVRVSVVSIEGRKTMKRMRVVTLPVVALLGFAMAIAPSEVGAQQKQRVSFKVDAANASFPQQHVIEIGDIPGHKLRVYELKRVFPNNAPMINGVKLK